MSETIALDLPMQHRMPHAIGRASALLPPPRWDRTERAPGPLEI